MYSTPTGQLPLPGIGLKFCIGCNQTKPTSDFYARPGGKFEARCKPCFLEKQRLNIAIRQDPALVAERERRRRDALLVPERTCTRCLCLLPSDCFPLRTNGSGLRSARCRECLTALRRADFEANLEHTLERRARWMQEKHAERMENTRRWRARNAEHRREYGRQWNAAHRKANVDRAMRWYYNNPDRVRELRRLRKARVRGNGGTFSEQDWERVKARHDWKCLACGAREPDIKLHADHVVPLALGGWNIISNIQPLCGKCNNRKNATFIDYRPDPFGMKKGHPA